MHKSIIITLLSSAFLLLAPMTASAGFFESLFSIAPPAPQPTAAPEDTTAGPSYRHRRNDDGRRRASHDRHGTRTAKHAKTQSASSATSKLQKTTGLLNDPSLRAGDAVMTKDGIRLFAGTRGDHHEVDDFVPLKDAGHVKKEARAVLASIDDAAHRDVGRERNEKASATGRSAAKGSDERLPSFTHPDVLVRYVGP